MSDKDQKLELMLVETYAKKISKEAIINFIGATTGVFLNYLLVIILTRNLTPYEFGTFSLAYSIVAIFTIMSLPGIQNMLERYIPMLIGIQEIGKAKTILYASLKYSILIGVVWAGIIFLTSDMIGATFFQNALLGNILKILILMLPLSIFIELVGSYFRALKELRYRVYLSNLFIPGLKTIVALVIFMFGLSLVGWSVALLGISFLASVLALFFFRKVRAVFKDTLFQSVNKRDILHFTWPLAVTGLLGGIIPYLTNSILGYFGQVSSVGVFHIYFISANMLAFALFSLNAIYRPIASELFGQNKIYILKMLYRRVSKWAFLVSGFGFLVVAFLGKYIIGAFLSQEYVIMPSALIVLAAGQLINNVVGPTGVTMLAFGQARALAFFVAGQFVLNIILAVVLVPRFGILGASIAVALSLGLANIGTLFYVFLNYRIQPFTRIYFRILLSFIVTSAFLFLVVSMLPLTIPGLLFWIGLTAIVFFGCLIFTKSLDTLDFVVGSHIIRGLKLRAMSPFR